jgi:hypothetical protein
MKLNVERSVEQNQFQHLPEGALFTNEEGKGLFVKINATGWVVVPLYNGVRAGLDGCFRPVSKVLRVTEVAVKV